MQLLLSDHSSEEHAGGVSMLRAIQRQQRTRLDRRQAQRVPLELHVLYTSEQGGFTCDGEGRVRNLSKKGCQLIGTTPLAAGSRVTLSLDLRDGQPPLYVSGALVCWTDGHCFSVKFPPITDVARYRLQQMVLKFAACREVSRTYAAFRIQK